MSVAQLAGRAGALTVATVLLLVLGLDHGLQALVIGVGLVALGWILHDDTPPAPRGDPHP